MGNATTIEETFAMINRGYSFNKTEFQDFIKNHQIVNYEAIQSYRSETVTKESFKRGYEEELKRRKKLIAKIKKQMYSDKQKLDGVRVLLSDANQNTQYNKYGIMINSKLDITLIEPRHLPPMNINGSCDPFVVVTVNDEDVYQSEVISTQQGQRAYWKESLSIPIETGSECITLSVFDNNEQQGNQFIGGFAVYLETLFDQEVHRRWYDLEFEDIRQGGLGGIELLKEWGVIVDPEDIPTNMDSSYSMSVATIATLDVASALDKSGVNFDFSAHDVSFEQIELELEKIRKEAALDTKSSNDEKLELSDDQPEELNQVLTEQFQSQLEREIVKETDEESQISIQEVDQQQIPQKKVEEISQVKQKKNLKFSQPIEESKIIRYEYSFPSESSDIKKNTEYEEIAEESEDEQESFIKQQNLEQLVINSFETISEVEVIQEVEIQPPKKGKYIGVALVHQLLNSKKSLPLTRI